MGGDAGAAWLFGSFPCVLRAGRKAAFSLSLPRLGWGGGGTREKPGGGGYLPLTHREARGPGLSITAGWGLGAHGCAPLSRRVWGWAGGEEGSRWGEGGEEAGEGGGGPEPAWRREVGPSSPGRSGGGLTEGGSILSPALSWCLPIRFLSLGSTRIPGTEN